MFGYEVGTDTNQVEDGNNWGHRYISVKVTRTNLLSSKASGRFIFMGLTYETGEPVLFICIFSVKILSVTDVKVFNYR